MAEWRSYWKFCCYGRINLHEENYDIGSLWTRSYDVQQLADRGLENGDEVSAYTYLAAYLHAYISHQGRTLKFDNFYP